MISNIPPVDAHTKYDGYGNEAFDIISRRVGQLVTEGDINMELWSKYIQDKANQFNIGVPPVEEPSVVPAVYFDDVNEVLVYIDADNNRTTYTFGGNVIGPASSTDNAIARFDSTTGKVIQNSTVTLDDTGNISGVETIQLNTNDTPTVGVGQVGWNVDEGTINIGLLGGNVTLQVGQETNFYGRNMSGATLNNGSVVKVTGASGDKMTVELAGAGSELLSSSTIGFATETINHDASGYVTTQGLVRGLDTSTYNEGDALWLSTTAGQFTATKPSSPNHLVFLGWVVRVHATEGMIYAHVSNGRELDELHDVLIGTKADKQSLFWDNTAGVWVNRLTTIGDISGFTASQLNTAVTDNDVVFINGGNTFSGTQNISVTSMSIGNDNEYPLFSGVGNKGVVLGYDTAGDAGVINAVDKSLAWKNIGISLYSNLGVGTTSPTEKLDVNGNAKVSGSLTVNGQNRTSGWTSFTPTVQGSGGGTVGSYGVQSGLYKVKGKSVECLIRIRFTKGTLTGNVQVPLPIVATGHNDGQFLGGTICNDGTNPLTASLGIPSLYTTIIQFTRSAGSALTAFTDLGAGTIEIGVSFTYQTT